VPVFPSAAAGPRPHEAAAGRAVLSAVPAPCKANRQGPSGRSIQRLLDDAKVVHPLKGTGRLGVKVWPAAVEVKDEALVCGHCTSVQSLSCNIP